MTRSRCAVTVLMITFAAAPSFAQAPPVAAVAAPVDRGADFWSAFDKESLRIQRADSLFRCANWTGPLFKASQDYPTTVPPTEEGPWRALRVESDPAAYLKKVLDYVLEGNEAADWRVQDNKVRKWFHAPWMTFNRNGREPIRGLTKELDSEPGQLDPKQDGKVRNWAVAIYNAPGGYVFGKVWDNPRQPTTAHVTFPIGTVTAKLLFTEADPEKVSLLKSPDALVWKAAVKGRVRVAKASFAFAQVAEPQDVRLLQLDLAVRDERVPTATGWVFGTYYFDAAQPGSKWYEKLVCAGVMWGNDPELTHAAYKAGTRPKNGWVNPAVLARFAPTRKCGEMGLRGRVNGPVDNPLSSCLSCHGRASDILPPGKTIAALLDDPKILGATPGFQVPAESLGLKGDKGCDIDESKAAAGEAKVRNWFRDLGPSDPFEPGLRSLDYSLQLGDGAANFYAWACEFKEMWKRAPAGAPVAAAGEPIESPSRYCLSGFDCITNFGRGECVSPEAESRPASESRPVR